MCENNSGLSSSKAATFLKAALQNVADSVSEIDLSDNPIEDIPATQKIIKAALDTVLARGKACKNISKLTMAGCKLGPAIIRILGQFVSKWHSIARPIRKYTMGGGYPLTHLDFSNNPLENSGAQALKEAFHPKSGAKVTELALAGCKIGDEGIEAIANILQDVPTVHILQLRENVCGDKGIYALCSAAVEHPSLRSLDVSGNDNVKRAGAIALAHLAQRNKKFKKFAFLNEELDETGLDMLRLLSIAASDRSERSKSVPLRPQSSKASVSKSAVAKKLAQAAQRRKNHT
eukprot:jgi/Bigna1/129438/aug1.9_g4146